MSNNRTYQTHKETPAGRALTIERRARRADKYQAQGGQR